MKEKDCLLLKKGKGKFFTVYEDDALIINCLFQYKILDGPKCGFPDNAIEKIKRLLNNLHISYKVIIDDDVKEIRKYDDNQYRNYVNIANKCLDINVRYDNLIKKLKECNQEKLSEIMELIEKCLES